LVSGLNWPTYNRAGSSWATCLVLGWGLRWPEHMASAILVLGLLSTTSYLIILGPFEINWLGLFILPTLQDIVSLGPVQVFASPQLTSLTLIKPNYNIFIFIYLLSISFLSFKDFIGLLDSLFWHRRILWGFVYQMFLQLVLYLLIANKNKYSFYGLQNLIWQECL